MKTRKITALMLTLTMIASAVLIGGNVSASTKSTPKTYIAGENVFYNSGGAVYTEAGTGSFANKLVYKPAKGKAKKLLSFDEAVSGIKFYLRGNTVYYGVTTVIDGNTEPGIFTVGTNGKNKKHIADGTPVGGYGSAVIYANGGKYYSYSNGKSKKLISASRAELFSGKLYTDSGKAVDLATGKTKTFAKVTKLTGNDSRYYRNILSSKNYLYYLDSKRNLVCMDAEGNKSKVDSKVTSILGANNGKTVLYSKGGTVYKKTLPGDAVKLASKSAVLKLTKDAGVYNYNVYSATVSGSTFILGVSYKSESESDGTSAVSALVSYEKNGRKMKLLKKAALDNADETDRLITSCRAYDGKVYYTESFSSADTAPWDSHYFKSVSIK